MVQLITVAATIDDHPSLFCWTGQSPQVLPFLIGGLLSFMGLSGCRKVRADTTSIALLLHLMDHLHSLSLSSDDLMDFLLIRLTRALLYQ